MSGALARTSRLRSCTAGVPMPPMVGRKRPVGTGGSIAVIRSPTVSSSSSLRSRRMRASSACSAASASDSADTWSRSALISASEAASLRLILLDVLRRRAADSRRELMRVGRRESCRCDFESDFVCSLSRRAGGRGATAAEETLDTSSPSSSRSASARRRMPLRTRYSSSAGSAATSSVASLSISPATMAVSSSSPSILPLRRSMSVCRWDCTARRPSSPGCSRSAAPACSSNV
mmetsp:Transcript_184/g.737  ORF Transcript_184/g.737 Transcript_184/m.737 type:complete len:234 (-) Transcript_184:1216-1917(-)